MSALLSQSLKGSGNPFFGRKHSIKTREEASARMLSAPHPLRGKPQPEYLGSAVRAAITGVPRSAETREKISAKATERHKNFDYLIRKVLGGKTSGQPGIFYIVRIGDRLKFGSATTTMSYRLTRLRQKHGPDIEVMAHALVDDAGGYEAAMMERHRERWLHGEFFALQGVGAARA